MPQRILRDDVEVTIESPSILFRGTDGTQYHQMKDGGGTGIFADAPFVNVKDRTYGAKGDNVADDTAAIEAAYAFAANRGGGNIIIPPGRYKISGSLAPPENVALLGTGSGCRIAATPPTILDGGTMTSPVIDCTSKGVTVAGLAFFGKNASGSIGIRTSDAFGWVIHDCFFNNFGDQAVVFTGGAGGRIQNVKAQNSLLVRTSRSDYVGVIDVSSTDTFIHQVELTSSSSANDTGNGYLCALRVNGDNGFVSQSILEISETGLYVGPGVASAGTRIVNVRADLNYADGFRVAGIRNDLTNCFSYRNGQAANNTYDGFVVSGTLNQLVGCRATSLSTGNKMRYGINDMSGASGSNHYLGYMTSNMATAPTNGVTAGTAPYAATT